MVNGGFVPNWCARAALERTSVSGIVEVGVEVEERRASGAVWSVVGVGIAWGLGSGIGSSEVGAMSPGATLGIGVLA